LTTTPQQPPVLFLILLLGRQQELEWNGNADELNSRAGG